MKDSIIIKELASKCVDLENKIEELQKKEDYQTRKITELINYKDDLVDTNNNLYKKYKALDGAINTKDLTIERLHKRAKCFEIKASKERKSKNKLIFLLKTKPYIISQYNKWLKKQRKL